MRQTQGVYERCTGTHKARMVTAHSGFESKVYRVLYRNHSIDLEACSLITGLHQTHLRRV